MLVGWDSVDDAQIGALLLNVLDEDKNDVFACLEIHFFAEIRIPVDETRFYPVDPLLAKTTNFHDNLGVVFCRPQSFYFKL